MVTIPSTNAEPNVQHHRCTAQKDALPGVEANKRILVVRLNDQKNDRRDNREIGDCPRGIV